MRAFGVLLLSIVALVWPALGGSAPVSAHDARGAAMLRTGHQRDDRLADGPVRTRMLRAASGMKRARPPISAGRIRFAAFDDLDDDPAGGDDGAPAPPLPTAPNDDAGTECSPQRFHARVLQDDGSVVAAAEESANLGPVSGFARRHEHPPRA